MTTLPVALQLYTVRDETAKDFVGTLRRVAEIGYAGVEFAGFGNLSAGETKALLDDLGMRPVGAHTGVDPMEKDPMQVIDYQLAIGNTHLVISWGAPDSVEGWRAQAERLNAIGAVCKEHGIQLCYHNHAHEFIMVEGRRGLDLLYDFADPSLVKAELDTHWIQKGGENPAAYVTKYGGRVPLLHVKDMAADGAFAEFGTGILDWEAILAAAGDAGVKWYIVEQDVCTRPTLESAEISFRNLTARLA